MKRKIKGDGLQLDIDDVYIDIYYYYYLLYFLYLFCVRDFIVSAVELIRQVQWSLIKAILVE